MELSEAQMEMIADKDAMLAQLAQLEATLALGLLVAIFFVLTYRFLKEMGWGAHRQARLVGWLLVPVVGSALLAPSFYTAAGMWLVALVSIAVTELLLVFTDASKAARS